MKVTKGQTRQEDRKVIAFYAYDELMFRDRYSDKNYVLSDENCIHTGGIEFDKYVEMVKSDPSFIAFYEGDTIIIEL